MRANRKDTPCHASTRGRAFNNSKRRGWAEDHRDHVAGILIHPAPTWNWNVKSCEGRASPAPQLPPAPLGSCLQPTRAEECRTLRLSGSPLPGRRTRGRNPERQSRPPGESAWALTRRAHLGAGVGWSLEVRVRAHRRSRGWLGLGARVYEGAPESRDGPNLACHQHSRIIDKAGGLYGFAII